MSGARTDILTYSRDYFNFADIRSNKILIDDIAQGLSNVCRFAGQCPRYYSVAQHSVLVYRLLRDVCGVDDLVVLMQGLLHDATEAYLGDMTTPLKRMMPQYRETEDELQRYIMQWFSLPADLDAWVKKADLMALAVEKRELWHNRDAWVVLEGIDEVPWTLIAMQPGSARAQFMSEYQILSNALKATL